jgi:hypothetical protein
MQHPTTALANERCFFVGVDGPDGIDCAWISRIGMDTSKHVFQLHGVNAAQVVVLRKKLRRKEMVAFFEKLFAASSSQPLSK